MKNAWMICEKISGLLVGMGTGELDTDQLDDSVIVIYRDTLDEIRSLPLTIHNTTQIQAQNDLSILANADRTTAKRRKADCARRFLADVPEPDVIESSDPAAIPMHYVQLFDEYWQTYDIPTTAGNPWGLARLIVQKAEDRDKNESLADSIAEAKHRRKKVLAEIKCNSVSRVTPDG